MGDALSITLVYSGCCRIQRKRRPARGSFVRCWQCRGTGLQLTGAAPGGWYWQHGDRNAAVAPLVCPEALGGPGAVVPGGVTAEVTAAGTLIRHDTAKLVGIVPHLAGNECADYATPYWQGDGGVVVRPAEGRETVRVRVQCGRTYSTITPSAGEDGVIAELVRKRYCTDDEGNPKQGRLTVTGAAPGGWYWINGEANAAVAPLMCSGSAGRHGCGGSRWSGLPGYGGRHVLQARGGQAERRRASPCPECRRQLIEGWAVKRRRRSCLAPEARKTATTSK